MEKYHFVQLALEIELVTLKKHFSYFLKNRLVSFDMNFRYESFFRKLIENQLNLYLLKK